MKKVVYISLVLGLSVVLSGCFLNPLKNDNNSTEDSMTLSEDDSVEVIEEELNDTDLDEFEAELDAMDEEINQL
jgi:hypothetical protein